MKPMYTTAAGDAHAGNGRSYQNGLSRYGRLGWIRTRVTDWVRDFF